MYLTDHDEPVLSPSHAGPLHLDHVVVVIKGVFTGRVAPIDADTLIATNTQHWGHYKQTLFSFKNKKFLLIFMGQNKKQLSIKIHCDRLGVLDNI